METTTISTETPAEDTPPPPTFDDLPLGSDVRAAIDEMGYVHPTPVQLATYEPAVGGRDIIVQARTGTGKTAAFGIAIVDRLIGTEGGAQALVLAPTRELALQSSRELERIGKHRDIHTVAVYGGAPMERQVKALRAGAQIVSGTPGRVLDHLRRGTLAADGLRVLVLDEADEMLSMGFAKELNAIMALLPTPRQTMLFSATVDEYVQRMADRSMTDPIFIGLSSDAVGATTVSHFTYLVSGKGKAQDLVKVLEVEDPESAIIFCNTKAETERLAATLKQEGFDADWLNGDLPQGEREKIMARTRRGELRFMVATDVAARGIDISHLTHVINFDFPEAVEQYIHRTGRTGRAGRTGTAVSLVSPKELGGLYYLRLQYKIFPVERSLPTTGEKRTRLEADRVALLEEAFDAPAGIDRAVARRVLTHPDAETLVAGLLSGFFGTRDAVDEQAAAARRSKNPAPAPMPAAEAEATDTGPKRRRPRPGGAVAEAVEAPDESEPRERTDDDDVEMTRLYVNLGRKDEIRAGDVAKLIREHTELGRTELGRIRVRDKHTFVYVATERAAEVIRALHGQTAHDRELVVEPAKTSK